MIRLLIFKHWLEYSLKETNFLVGLNQLSFFCWLKPTTLVLVGLNQLMLISSLSFCSLISSTESKFDFLSNLSKSKNFVNLQGLITSCNTSLRKIFFVCESTRKMKIFKLGPSGGQEEKFLAISLLFLSNFYSARI